MRSINLSRSLSLSIIEGGLATAMGSLFSGVFLVSFALAMGASRLQVGVLFTLPSLCSFAQLLGSYWIERGVSSRWICLVASAASRLMYIPLLLVPLMISGSASHGKVWCIIAIMAASDFVSSIAGVAWLTWTKRLVPGRLCVSFFGRRNLVSTGLSFVVCLLGGALIDKVNAVTEEQVLGFVVAFVLAMSCGVVGWFVLACIPDRHRAAPATRIPFLKSLASPLKEANFRRIIAFYSVWNMAAAVAAPFTIVYLRERLNLSVQSIVALGAVGSIAGLAANNFWTRLAQRFGVKPVVLVATLGDALFPLLLAFVDARWLWTLIPVHLAGAFGAPMSFSVDSFLVKLSPTQGASPYMAVLRTAVGLATAVGAVAAGALADVFAGPAPGSGVFVLDGLKFILLVSFVGRLASLWLLAGVYELNARPVRELLCSLLPEPRSVVASEIIPSIPNRPLSVAPKAILLCTNGVD